MNTRRQTIWLVSMLGLMVVLSAYYLFTDNADKMDIMAEGEQQIAPDAIETGDYYDSIDLDELLGASGVIGDFAHDHGHGAAADHDDEHVLQKVQAGALTGEERMAELDRLRNDMFAKETEKWMNIAMDTRKSNEEIAEAEARLHMLEEQQAIISDLEDQLMREYGNVVITEENGKWRVVVQADKLNRKEVVTIIDMLMDGLKVAPGKVAVEYVK